MNGFKVQFDSIPQSSRAAWVCSLSLNINTHQYYSPLSLVTKISFDIAIENRYIGLLTDVQSEDIELL